MSRRWSLIILLALASGCSGAKLKAAVRQDLDAQIRARQPSLALCYKAALERDRALRGELTLLLAVAPNARQVSEVQIPLAGLVDAELRRCVLSNVQGLTISEPMPRPLEISYPLRFSPSM
jgi:hypothetical protein